MRRFLLAGGLLLALLLLPTPAWADDEHIGLHDMNCNGITAMGSGMPASSTLHLALVDPARGETIAEQRVRTSATGEFETRLRAGLQQRLTVRLQVSGPGGERIGFAQHSMTAGSPMCDLPFTGPGRAAVLLVVAAVLLSLGGGILLATRRPAPSP